MMVRSKFEDRRLADIPGEVSRQLASAQFGARLRPGARVAIGVGSRGIENLAVIVLATVRYWQKHGIEPFLFPAMGSHGSATAEGQASVLAHYGITEASMGCPIVSQLEVVSLGKTNEGIEAYLDRAAYEADGVMLINRVKWHTDFSGKIESGLFKMMAIGAGKLAGAQRYHSHGFRLGLEHVIRTVGRQALASGKILGGLAILEDACHNTAKIDAVPADEMETREEENLALAKSWMGKLPLDIDILILDEIGKNISGVGMDTKTVNRGINGDYNPWPNTPRVERIFLRDLHELSYGNAVGVGMADVVADRLLGKIDWEATRLNSLTANAPAGIRIPVHYPTDRECLERFAPTVGRINAEEVTFGWIRNSNEIARVALSENLRPQVERRADLEIESLTAFAFDAAGNLISPFAP